VLRLDPFTNQPLDGPVLKELGRQVKGLLYKPQSVEYHGFDCLSGGHVAPGEVLVDGLVDSIVEFQFLLASMRRGDSL